MRPGHIPGAVHLHASANLDPANWTYLAPEGLQARAQATGIRPEQRVITYCGVGISASLGLFSQYRKTHFGTKLALCHHATQPAGLGAFAQAYPRRGTRFVPEKKARK